MPIQLSPLLRDKLGTGLWVCSGSPAAAEILAGSGADWLLIDGEHSPIGLETITSLLRAVQGYEVAPVVRVPVNDTALIKQYLDLGVQNLMVPMVHTVADAEAAVAAMHYPPRGVRGVGSALARSSRWNRVPGYLADASTTLNCIVQIESRQAVDNAAGIAAVDGVDAIFIGPSDLAATMGYLGQQSHPEVLDAVHSAIDAARAAGKFVGVNAFDETQARAYLDAGVDFIAVGADVQLLAKSSDALVERFNND
ncbi:HpcH/HpaI aldolase family protein [Corynebacterium epidermidicanis]|uniref:2,4-dihydroxyhept-2-enedioate aldolase n=1 Tax=Corynebacterium epidermidicanis TaxID=1050174 RepID=A0A0G3GXG3_9CORY|nr:aldolase/citrate lyase family protein [Corynebacterium epidermidicanis]AKK04203.1 2,4-dihydroxyhept-2-enedioate aldolase [Corynebacterium epidermidicanis]